MVRFLDFCTIANVRPLEHRRAGDENVGAAVTTSGAVSGAMPPSTSMRMSRSPISFFTRAILSTVTGMNACPPKPGLTVMTRMRSSRSSTYSIALSGVAGLSATPAFFAELADRVQRPVEMPGRLGVDGDAVAAGPGEGLQVGVAGFDHQMAVEHLVRVRAQGRDHRRSEGDVGHEVPVHHVEVNPVGAGRGDFADLLAEL